VTTFLVRRLFWSVVVLVVVSAVTFFIFFAVPSDPAHLIAGKYANAESVALIRHQLGLDRPLPLQLGRFLARAAIGDWGYSYVSQQPVLPTILTSFPKTLSLTTGAMLIWLAIGIPFGILSALRPRSIWDRLATLGALIGVSAPVYWLGLVLLRVFADALGWFPLGDYQVMSEGGVLGWAQHLMLPWVALAMLYAGWYARLTRSQMLDVMRLDYVRTARAKGLPPRDVIGRHVLRNALLPLVTMLGIDVAYLMGGAVLTESVFGIPGIGGLAWRAIRQRDLPMVMGTVLFAATFIVLANLLVDVLYKVLDPRIRVEE
jgi:peptide/nickel transport system permease protein